MGPCLGPFKFKHLHSWTKTKILKDREIEIPHQKSEMIIVRKGIFERKPKQVRAEEREKALALQVIKKIKESR